MLLELRISNLAVVEDTVLTFGSGLNVLTGSTGAGKSIVLTAVSLLSGQRADRSLIRKGSDNLLIEGDFRVMERWPMKEMLGMKADDESVSIKRVIDNKGKSRIWINGISSTNSLAREIASELLELHGQHDHQELLNPETHIDYLDHQGDYQGLLEECEKKSLEFRSAHNHLMSLIEEEAENRRKKDFYEFQFRELEKLDMRRGLKRDLEERAGRANNIHEVVSSLESAKMVLDDSERSVIEGLEILRKRLEGISSVDGKWRDAAKSLDSMIMELNELSRDIDRDLEKGEEEPEDLERLQERLSAIQRAERKYGKDFEGLIEYREWLKNVLKGLEEGSDEIVEARLRRNKSIKELLPVLEKLSEKRKDCRDIIDEEVSIRLRELGIEGALFKTRIDSIEIKSLFDEAHDIDLPLKGRDKVEFMIRTNIGEDLKPLCEIVSGGELSRITLVLRSMLVRKKGIPTLIFDEIDTGLGADTGERVAEKMKELAESYQVVCITHLAQIAAASQIHFLIRKEIIKRRTISSAIKIDGEERVVEIARMLGGKRELSKQLASELINGNCARSSGG